MVATAMIAPPLMTKTKTTTTTTFCVCLSKKQESLAAQTLNQALNSHCSLARKVLTGGVDLRANQSQPKLTHHDDHDAHRRDENIYMNSVWASRLTDKLHRPPIQVQDCDGSGS